MIRVDSKGQLSRILAVVLCVAVAVFFSVLLMHSHGAGTAGDHAAHCQVCAMGQTAAFTATVASLTVAFHLLSLIHAGTPRRGSPRFLDVPTTRPPPIRL